MPPTSLVPSPEQLAQYQRISMELPGLVVRAADHEKQREFYYAITSLISGTVLAQPFLNSDIIGTLARL